MWRVAVMLLAGCGRFAFDATPDATNTASDGSDAAPMLALSSPADGAQVLDSATLNGTCIAGAQVTASGDLQAPVSDPCGAGTFSLQVMFTDGTGDKAVTITQGSTSITRHFVRVGGTVAHGNSAGGAMQSQGFNVNCTLSILKPAGAVDGDVLVGVIFTDAGSTGSITAAGWTVLAQTTSNYMAFYKRASGEPGLYQFPIVAGTGTGDTCESAGVISAFSNVNPLVPIGVTGTTAFQPMTTTIIATTVDAPQAGILIALFGSNGPSTGIAGVGEMTCDPGAASSGDWANALLCWQLVATGTTGARATSIAQARDSGALLVEILP